jgi:hypothetical protein
MKTNFKTELQNTLTTLVAQREHWEHGVYKQANAELYAILEQCAGIYAQLKEDKAHARAFNALADELGIKFNKGTSLALKIVRVVFGQESNREYAYARVLKVWFDEHSDAQTLTNFVIERGGIENVRRTASNTQANKLKADDYRDIAANALTGENALVTFGLHNYMLSDSENDTDYMVALVHCDKNGNGKIVYGSNKRALVDNALAVIGKELDEQQAKAASKDTLDDVKQRKTADVKQFAARVLANKTAA